MATHSAQTKFFADSSAGNSLLPSGCDAFGESSLLLKQVRDVLVLIEQYLLLWRMASKRYCLEPLVRAVMVRVSRCFLNASQAVGGATASLHPDHARCLFELESFAQSLGSACFPSAQEIAHAMDGVLVFCLVLDSQWRESVLPDEDGYGPGCETGYRLIA
jgi:hypothetical protein